MGISSSISNSRVATRRVVALVLFLAAIAAGDRFFGFVLKRLCLHSQFRFSMLYSGRIKADVIVLGDSRAAAGYYAPLLSKLSGARVYNLAYNGMSSLVAEAVFADYLERNPSPKAVIIDVSSVFSNEGLVNQMRLYGTSSTRITRLLRKQDSRVFLFSALSWLFRFNSEMFLRAMYYLSRTDQHWANRYSISNAQIRALSTVKDKTVSAPKSRINALVHIGKMARTRGIAVRCTVAPYAPGYREHLMGFGNLLKEIRERMAPFCDVVDLSCHLHDFSDFADYLHVNIHGARRLAPILVRRLGLTEFATVSQRR